MHQIDIGHGTTRCLYLAWPVNFGCEYVPPYFFFKTHGQKTNLLNQNYLRTMMTNNSLTIFVLRTIINLSAITLDQFEVVVISQKKNQVEVETTYFGFQTVFMDIVFWLGFAEITSTCCSFDLSFAHLLKSPLWCARQA